MNWRNSKTNNYKPKELSFFKKLKLKISSNSIIVTLLMTLITISLTYYLNLETNRNSFCIQQVKSFNLKSFTSKDISILHKVCNKEIKEFNFFEDILFTKNITSNSKDVFYRTIAEMYSNSKISKDEIIAFSDEYLYSIIKNNLYRFEGFKYESVDSKRKIDEFIREYINFKSNMAFEKIQKEEIASYSYIISYFTYFSSKLFKNTDIFTTAQDVIPNLDINFSQINKADLVKEPISVFEFKNDFKTLVESLNIIKASISIVDNDMKVDKSLVLLNSFMNNNDHSELKKLTYKTLHDILTPSGDLRGMKYFSSYIRNMDLFQLQLYLLSKKELSNSENKKILFQVYNQLKSKKLVSIMDIDRILLTVYQFSKNTKLLLSEEFSNILNLFEVSRIPFDFFAFNEEYKLLNKIIQDNYDNNNDKNSLKVLLSFKALFNMAKKETISSNVFPSQSLLSNHPLMAISFIKNPSDKMYYLLFMDNLDFNFKNYPVFGKYLLNLIHENFSYIVDEKEKTYWILNEKKEYISKGNLLLYRMKEIKNDLLTSEQLTIKKKILIKISEIMRKNNNLNNMHRALNEVSKIEKFLNIKKEIRNVN